MTITNHLRLLVLGGVHDGRLIEPQTPFLIGRAAECNLRPASVAVSSRHCAIEVCDGVVVVRDLGSTNGTFLNDDRLTAACPLRDGDELRIGPLRFRVLDVSIRPEAEPVIPPEIPRDADDTIVHAAEQCADETVVNDNQMTDDEAAQLLLADDDENDHSSVNTATSEAVLRALDAIEEPAALPPTASAASDLLRQMRRTKK